MAHMHTLMPRRRAVLSALFCVFSALGGCALLPHAAPPGVDPLPVDATLSTSSVWVLTQDHQLVRTHPRQPMVALARVPLRGLPPGDELLGMDYRVARGELYALSRRGQLWRIDTGSGQLTAVGPQAPLPLVGRRFGMDFNPVADRIRVVSDAGLNGRIHPDSGAWVGSDPAQPGRALDPDLRATDGQPIQVAAAAYTYNTHDDKLTTNYAIDLLSASLVVQGSIEGAQPTVSPNTGRIQRVGALGLNGPLQDAAFDISDRRNEALAALRTQHTALYRIRLEDGRAQWIGALLDGQPVRALAIEP